MHPFLAIARTALCLVAVTAAAAWALAAAPPVRGEEPPAAQDGAEVDLDDHLGRLEAAEHRFNRAAAERDRPAFRALLAKDAVFLAGELHRGRLAVMAIWQPLFEGKYDFRYQGELLAAAVAGSGELGWTVGTVRTSFHRPGMAEAEVTDGHYLNVWRRGEANDWRLAYAASLVVHPTLGAGRDPRSGLMTAWPELADRIDAEIEIRWQPETTVRAASGELAYSFGTYRASFSSAQAGEAGEGADDDGAAGEVSAVAGEGHYLAVWHKDQRGRWQLAAEGFTPPGIYGE